MNKNDLRYIKTEKIIKESFKKCVEKHGFEKVNVSMICEEGLISRNAFYLHFTDKYDLLDRLFDEFRASILKSYSGEIINAVTNFDIFSATRLYADALIDNREEFLFLLSCSKERMEKIIQDIIVEMPVRKTASNFDSIVKNIKPALTIRYMFSAMVAYTELWFINFDKISREDAINHLYLLCQKPSLMYLENFKI